MYSLKRITFLTGLLAPHLLRRSYWHRDDKYLWMQPLLMVSYYGHGRSSVQIPLRVLRFGGVCFLLTQRLGGDAIA